MKKLLFFTLGLFLLGGEASAQKRNNALDFNVDVGYDIYTKGGSGAVFTQIGLGKRFNTNFYWGLGTGIIMPVSSGSKPMIPLTSDFRLYFPLNASKLSLGGVLRLGYAFNTAGETTVKVEGVEKTGDYEVTVEPSDYVMIQILPTLSIPISRRTDFNVGLGYTHFIATEGPSFGAVTISSGFNFGKLLPLTPKPIIDRGIQLSFDYGATGIGNYTMTGFGLAASYKFNPHLAVGLGFGYDSSMSDSDDDDPNYIVIEINSGSYEDSEHIVALENAYRLFARGVYRFTDKKLSPIAACDLGLRFFDCEVIDSPDPDYSYSTGPHFFVAPAVGGSLRMASNSYLDLKIGYHIEKDTSGLLLNLGVTHTFGWGAGKR